KIKKTPQFLEEFWVGPEGFEPPTAPDLNRDALNQLR
ncbi:hypothetical protein RCH13_002785, partial [Chryseobacterium sp. MP_3.2]|nr:hypothetical protein [Chryseobacterium sp. MP_3.2]